ncbi:MAG: YbaK/EbsC family protein [Myxococcota bacterium]
MTVLNQIAALLDAAAVAYTRIDHPPTTTAKEAADARNLPMSLGGKSLVMKLGTSDDFAVFAVSGDRKTKSSLIRRALGVQRFRFATRDELHSLTGLVPGCVPPFGRPIFDLPLYVDQRIAGNERIAFSPGRHDVSFLMSVADYLSVAQPERIFPFSAPR